MTREAASTWELVDERYLPGLAAWKESIFTIANGYLSTRGTFEEYRAGEVRASFINGLFVAPHGELPLLGAVPDWTATSLRIDGEPFSLDDRPPAGFRRILDLRSGVLTRTVLWRGAETGVVRLRFRRLVSMAEPHLAALELEITALTRSTHVDLATGIDAGVGSPKLPAWDTEVWQQNDAESFAGRFASVDGAHRLVVECAVSGLDDPKYVEGDRSAELRSSFSLAVGETRTVTKYVTYAADRDQGPAPRRPDRSITFDAAAAASRAAWALRWRTSAWEVGGDPDSEHALRFAAFHLIGAASPADPGGGIGARLLSGFGYRHHVFWDTDIFVVPYFSITQPDLARTHLAYRFRGLPGARRKAAKFGRRGAFYAWEAAGTGDEVTPEWSNPIYGPPVRIWTGEIEEHITADVAWAADHYWRWTGDDAFLRDEGIEMIVDGARYWASRLEMETDGAHIRDVIGPDEYHIHVDDSFYTNLLAAWQLRRAGEAAEWLAASYPDAHARLLSRLAITTEDLAGFRRAADRVVLRRRNDGVWEQHAGFFDLEALDLDRFEPRLHTMYDLLGEELLGRVAVIKQADVLMGLALLPEHAGGAEGWRANWEYYAPKADHGSSLSLSFHAMAACRLGEVATATELFRKAISIDLADSMGNGRDGIHAACQGGILQTAIFGFGGLSLEGGAPVLHPRLPDHWESFAFSFAHRGEVFDRELAR